jgi:hypothetical protein
MIFGTILHEHYEDLDETDSKKGNREKVEAKRELNQPIRLFRKFISAQIRIFGKFDFNGDSSGVKVFSLSICIKTVNKLSQFVRRFSSNKFKNCFIIFMRNFKMISQFCRLSRCHKISDKKPVDTQPEGRL